MNPKSYISQSFDIIKQDFKDYLVLKNWGETDSIKKIFSKFNYVDMDKLIEIEIPLDYFTLVCSSDNIELYKTIELISNSSPKTSLVQYLKDTGRKFIFNDVWKENEEILEKYFIEFLFEFLKN